MTPEQRAAYSAAQAVLTGTADVAQVANTFGLPLDMPREEAYAALLELAHPPATVMAFKPRPARPQSNGTAAPPTQAGSAVDPQAAKARAERQAADRKRNNLATLRSYRLKG